MANVVVEREQETDRGWEFVVAVGGARRVRVRVSWADYEHWAHGAARPEQVAAAVVRFLLDRAGEAAIPDAFDAAGLRRAYRDLDAAIPGLIGLDG